jgi:hypothetical protein
MATKTTEMKPYFLIVGTGFLTSLTTEKAFAYPVYENTMLTRAVERSFPLSVVPSKEFRKLAFGSGIEETFPPRTTKPVIEILFESA